MFTDVNQLGHNNIGKWSHLTPDTESVFAVATITNTHLVKSEPRELRVRCQAITGSPPEQAHSLHPAPAQPDVACSTTFLCAGHLLLHTDHFFGSRIASALDDFVDVDAITAAFSCVLISSVSTKQMLYWCQGSAGPSNQISSDHLSIRTTKCSYQFRIRSEGASNFSRVMRINNEEIRSYLCVDFH